MYRQRIRQQILYGEFREYMEIAEEVIALRQKLGVPRRRQIPVAFRLLTGEDPLASRLASARADNGG